MSYYGIGSDNASSFFSGYFGSTGSNNLSNSFGDWSLIKSGAYKKLLTAYYQKDSNGTETSAKADAQSSETSSDSVKMSAAVSDSDKLVSAIGNLFASVKDSSSTKDDLYKAAKKYSDAYNSLVKTVSDSDNKSVLRNELSITKNTKANDKLLKDVGITINTDNTLSVDETKFKSAKLTDLKSLFTGYSSYASHISNSAGMIYNTAKASVAAGSKACSYTSSGTYSKLLSNFSSYDRAI